MIQTQQNAEMHVLKSGHQLFLVLLAVSKGATTQQKSEIRSLEKQILDEKLKLDRFVPNKVLEK